MAWVLHGWRDLKFRNCWKFTTVTKKKERKKKRQRKMSEWRLITADILNCSWVNWNKLKETCSSFLLETLRTRPSGRLEVLGTLVFEDPLLPPSVQAHGVLGPASGRGDAGVNVVTWCSWSGDPRGSQCGGWVRCGGGGCCTGGGEEEKDVAEVLSVKDRRLPANKRHKH